MCSVTSQREPTPVTSASEFLKRPLQSGIDEPDLDPSPPPVKVKCTEGNGTVGTATGGGGGRRKQSKPIRVRSDDVEPPPPAVEDLVVDMKLPVTRSPPPDLGDLPAALDPRRDGPRLEAVSFNVDSSLKCDPAAAVFPTRYHQLGSELKHEAGLGSYVAGSDGAADDDGGGKTAAAQRPEEMVKETRGGSSSLDDLNRSPPQQEAIDCKSWHHQFSNSFYHLSSQLQDQSSMSKSDCVPTNLSLRLMKPEPPGNSDEYQLQTSGRAAAAADVDASRADAQESERFWESSDGGNGAEKSRIFHPDAYCDICDREFCNKYFLKTHRANKHGIYDASVGGGPSGSGSDLAGLSCNSAAATSVPPIMSGLVFNSQPAPALLSGVDTPSVSMSDREQHHASNSVSSASSLSGVLPIPQLPSSLGVLPLYDDPLSLPPIRGGGGTDMEDYCDICQKHFCNKYYLRKHRQDVHGLSAADPAARRSQAADFTTRGCADPAESSSAAALHFQSRVSTSSSTPLLPPSALANFPMFLPPPFGAPLPVVPPFLPAGAAAGLGFGSLQFNVDGGAAASSKLSTSSTSEPQPLSGGATTSLLQPPGLLSADAYVDLFRKELLGGYLLSNTGDRDVTSAIAAVAAAAAMSSGAAADSSSVPGGPRAPPLPPPLPTGSEPGAPAPTSETLANPTPDTFAEMLRRIGTRLGGKKNDVLSGALQNDLFRLNGLAPAAAAGRLPASLMTSTSSSASSSSRLVDRVVCDICNKEVCNKYFLKTHKMKVHGWDPNTSTVPAMSLPSTASSAITVESTPIKSEPHLSSSQPQPQPPLMYRPPLLTTQVDKSLPFAIPESLGLTPKEADLQKMGIDPEAYCEICRKEFCSKYFLRTHRQNIHGIQDASSSSSQAGSYQATAGPGMPLFSSAAPLPFSSVVLPLPTPPPLPPSLPSSLSTNCSTSSSSSVSSLFPYSAAAGLANSDSAGAPADGGHMVEQRSWKWKEPVNATRVSCTLCNKVLCNKYFLRTHMAKRHGLAFDTRLLPLQPPPPQPIKDLIHSSSNVHSSTNGFSQSLSSVDTATGDSADRKEVDCCADILGTTGAVNLVLSGRTSTDVQTVTARTWHVPADDTSPQSGDPCSHQSDPAPTSTPSRQLSDESVRCPLCAAGVADRDVLLRHLSTVHHVDDRMSLSLIAAAVDSTPPPPDGGLVPPQSQVARPPPLGAMRRRRQFRCAFCRERFRTRVHCELHARAAHPRASGSCVEVTPAAVDSVDGPSPPPPPSMSGCLPAPVYARPLDDGDSARAKMLPYVLRESQQNDDVEPHFSTALVYLPTFRPLTSPTTVTFTLTPILQPTL